MEKIDVHFWLKDSNQEQRAITLLDAVNEIINWINEHKTQDEQFIAKHRA